METLHAAPEAAPDFNPLGFLAPGMRPDPYPAFAELLAHGATPVPAFGVVVPTHADCAALLRDPRMSVDRTSSIFYRQAVEEGRITPEEDPTFRPFLFLDPPDHTRLRGLVSKAFTRKVVRDLEPRIHAIVDELLDAAAARGDGTIELVEDVAYPLPVVVISDLLGVPAEDRVRFAGWSKELAASIEPNFGTPDSEELARQMTAADEFRAYFADLAAQRRADPRDDLLSGLVSIEDQGGRMSEGELLTTCILLLVAGHETTVGLISNAMLALLRHPGELDLLRAEPALAEGAIEETLRYDPPVQFTGRIATEDMEVGGLSLAEGYVAMLVVAAANRDPAVFPDPGRFDIRRGETRHLSFGGGIHFCLGAPLARLEGQLALRALARRLERPRLLGDPPYRENAVLRGVRALPIGVDGIR